MPNWSKMMREAQKKAEEKKKSKLQRLCIPQEEKDKGLIWVVYLITYARPGACSPERLRPIGEGELAIRQGKN